MNEVLEEKSTENNGCRSDTWNGRIHASYLLSAVNYLKEIPSKALRCHWNILLSDTLQMKGRARSDGELEKLGVCPYCQTPWVDGDYHVKVMPKRKRGKKLRKLLKRVEEQKELSRIQKSLFNALHSGPSVVVNCKICRKSSKFKTHLNKETLMVSTTFKNVVQEDQDMPESQNKKMKKKKKKKKKKEKKKNQNGPSFGADITVEVQDENEYDCSRITTGNIDDDDDDDVVIMDENLADNEKSNMKPIKRKLHNNDSGDGDIYVFSPELAVTKKIKKDLILENPLQIKPLAVSGKQSGQSNALSDDFISSYFFKPTTKVNISSKKSRPSQGKQKKKIVSTECLQSENKKSNLSRWKKLIADQEAKATKTSSLQDFLSAL